MRRRIVPTDADFVAALATHFTDGKAAWETIKGAAVRAAARRLLDANRATRKTLNDGLAGLDHAQFIAEMDRFDRLQEENLELQRIAFPLAFSTEEAK